MTDIKKILTVWATVCEYNNLRRMLNEDLTPRGYVDLVIILHEQSIQEKRAVVDEELAKPVLDSNASFADKMSDKFRNEHRVKWRKDEIKALEADIQRLKDYLQELK